MGGEEAASASLQDKLRNSDVRSSSVLEMREVTRVWSGLLLKMSVGSQGRLNSSPGPQHGSGWGGFSLWSQVGHSTGSGAILGFVPLSSVTLNKLLFFSISFLFLK